MVGARRHSEHIARRSIRRRAAHKTMKITSSREVYRCRIFHVTEDHAVDAKTKFEIKRSVVRHGGSAVMMAVDDRKSTLVGRQSRPPAARFWGAPPAGPVAPGEKRLRRPRRELIEETGYRARTW